jgi:hypothetical protein
MEGREKIKKATREGITEWQEVKNMKVGEKSKE